MKCRMEGFKVVSLKEHRGRMEVRKNEEELGLERGKYTLEREKT